VSCNLRGRDLRLRAVARRGGIEGILMDGFFASVCTLVAAQWLTDITAELQQANERRMEVMALDAMIRRAATEAYYVQWEKETAWEFPLLRLSLPTTRAAVPAAFRKAAHFMRILTKVVILLGSANCLRNGIGLWLQRKGEDHHEETRHCRRHCRTIHWI
jgi:hypothetical protein